MWQGHFARTFSEMWYPRWSPRADLVLGLVCGALGQLEMAVIGPDPVRVLSAALGTLPVAWRQRAPLAATVVVAISWATFNLWSGFAGTPFFYLAALPVIYSLGAHPRLARAIAGAGTMLVVVAATDVRSFTFFASQFALLWLSGRGVRIYRTKSERLRGLADRLAGERGATERLAVAEERQRMAGELHDTIAHAVTVMVIQAGGAEQMLGHQPDRARTALITVQDTGRQAIAELRRVLRLLRGTQNSRPFGTDPLPSPVTAVAWWHRLVPRSAAGDLVLVAGMFVASEATVARHGDSAVAAVILGEQLDRTQVTTAICAGAACLTILIRRRIPLVALAIAALTASVELLLIGRSADFMPLVATMVAMYSVAASTRTRHSVPAAALAILVTSIAGVIEIGVAGLFVSMVWLPIPWFGGRIVRANQRQADELRTLTIRLGRERDARARLAVLDERARVARDLHDSVAHSVSVMVLQAGAAEQVMISSPDRARTAVRAVEDQGRQAHASLRQLLGFLDSDNSAARTPQPSLTRLDPLLAEVARAGLPITLFVHGLPTNLPAGVDISAYRIVQEGLTNALKHAGAVPTTVTLDYQPDALTIEIRDPGIGHPPPPTDNGGLGLLGMRERVTHYGGTLETGPIVGGGFAIRARLPLDSAPDPQPGGRASTRSS